MDSTLISSLEILAVVILAVVAVIRLFTKPLKLIFKLLIHAALGYVLLWLINFFGDPAGINVPLNTVDILISAVCGIPGVIGMVIYYFVV